MSNFNHSNPYINHINYFKDVYKSSKIFWIEKIFMLFLMIIWFFLPSLFVRFVWSKLNYKLSKIIIEFYVIVKPIIILLMLYLYPYNVISLIIWFIFWIDTMVYLLNMIFNYKLHKKTILITRKIILLIFNLLEIILFYAFLYTYTKSIYFSGGTFITYPIDSIYFSFVTFATVWYWDMQPIVYLWKIIVSMEILNSILYFTIISSVIISQLWYIMEKDLEENIEKDLINILSENKK